MTVRVRFAPSPTGHLHIGGVRTALFNFLYARHTGGRLILRLEDTDVDRNVPGAEQAFVEAFKWLGLTWDEGFDIGGPYGPYRCSERLPIYRAYAEELMASGRAYACFCAQGGAHEERPDEDEDDGPRAGTSGCAGECRAMDPELARKRVKAGEPHAVRFLAPPGPAVVVRDRIRGEIAFEREELRDFVILKRDGMPTYNFQVAIDDHLMAITHVIRGEEHLSNTPRQLLIYEALGFTPPEFAHLPIVLDETRKKLSKRDPNVLPVSAYRELGYLPEAIVNFLALLGWSPGGEEEMFGLDELCARFDLDRVGRAGAVFDLAKFRWMANQYFKALEPAKAVRLIREQAARLNYALPPYADDDWLARAVALVQDGLACARDFFAAARVWLEPDVAYDEEALALISTEGAARVIRAYLSASEADPAWNEEANRARLQAVGRELGVKGRDLLMPVRAALTGQTHGPDLQKSMALLPRHIALARMRRAAEIAHAEGHPGR
ncbi:glutamate--tRNA ligase [Alicyclobacillus vulcanalis]|uniref:Glutamate--tRNA ligase n=1 Tax=Alicyclobacillus vulcanalis TaxID=252246 RepID=A0A1N7LDW7_9BACL|nr:glutamate--tRNA ligase [Alicyclobacillus vulcanalis]SIS72028.1 glutamyl-tRNA synthetase /glutamate--tRNA(Gln) ligase [Alicyclobacillus vulcanalis]